MPPLCSETALDRDGCHRVCVQDVGHDGGHQDVKGYQWEPPGVALDRLRARWGSTHRIAWTGSLWLATAHDRRARWRSHVEPTPDQLEASLRRHAGQPQVPAQRRNHDLL